MYCFINVSASCVTIGHAGLIYDSCFLFTVVCSFTILFKYVIKLKDLLVIKGE
jgi:hypothetical protein